jgi:hypothetical protein
MHLPTINHIKLKSIKNFPLSSLTPSVNLHHLDISSLLPLKEDFSPESVVQSEMMPQIREFHVSGSNRLMTKLLHAKTQDGRPAFKFMDLRRLSMNFTQFELEDERNIRYLLQNAKLLEKLHLSVDEVEWSLVGLHNILSPTARTLKALDLTVSVYDSPFPLPLEEFCKELEAIAGHNVLETLSLEVKVGHETPNFVGSIFQKVEEVLVKPRWSALRQVSFKVSNACCGTQACWEFIAKLSEALQYLPDKYLSHLPKLDSVAFNFSYDDT